MRVFVAIDIPEDLGLKIEAFGKEVEKFGIRTVKQENLHITLAFLGEKNDRELEKIKEELRTIQFGKFKVELLGVGSFRAGEVEWVGVNSNELEELVKDIENSIGLEEKFTGHLTFARAGRKRIEKTELMEWIEKNRNTDFGSFEVSHFSLMKSTFTNEGIGYSKVETFKAKKR